MPPRLADVSADLDALYRAPLAEFVTRRNSLAVRLRGEQGADAAAAVKALAKPSGTAWVVNQLYWRHQQDFDRLMKAGDRLRDVQQQRLAGNDDADMRTAAESRQAALAALMARVSELLGEAGLSASMDMRQRVTTTLEALSIYGGREPGPRAGRLVEDVDPPGFAALAALVPPVPGSMVIKPAKASKSAPSGLTAGGPTAHTAPTAAAPRALRGIDTKRVKEAKAALDRAEDEREQAQAVAKTAHAARQKAEAAWQKARAALDEIQQQLDAAMDREREAQDARDAARKAAATAQQALDRAERTRDQAERAYQGEQGR